MTNEIRRNLLFWAMCLTVALACALDPALAGAAEAAGWAATALQTAEARTLVPRAQPLTVAVIDTGVDTDHPLLKNALWRNPGETGRDAQGRDKSANGRDDDGNGFVDDVSGWNFAGRNNDLSDHHGHGTHIAGLIGAQSPGHPESEGVAPGVRLMILKYYDPRAKNADNLRALIEALRYAVRMRVPIINYSGGGAWPSAEEKRILEQAGRQGQLVVAAAGNESSNSDLHPFFPADYGLTNVISVGGHNPHARRVPSSNYGPRSVDFAAPGEDILSTLPFGERGERTGTSQATAFVTGAAALLLSQRPDWAGDPARLAAHLRDTARFETGLLGQSKTSGRLDLLRVLALQNPGRSFSGHCLEPCLNLKQ